MQICRTMCLAIATLSALAQSTRGLEELTATPVTSNEQRRSTRQQFLDELILSIRAACDLTEAEIRRLQVASKGAVEYSFTDAAHNQQIERGRRGEVAWKRLGFRAHAARLINSLDAAAAARHPIWTRTLQRTLTSKQLQRAGELEKRQLEKWTQRFRPQRNLGVIRVKRLVVPVKQVRPIDAIIKPLPQKRSP